MPPPPFVPHPLLLSGHLQTIAGLWPTPARIGAVSRRVDVPDGALIAHDDVAPCWRAGDPLAVLVHGLGGHAASGYMRRVAARLRSRGARTLRLDLRGIGAAAGLGAGHYNAGASRDLAAALVFAARLCPGSPLTLVAFSLGGAIALKLLGEGDVPAALARALVVCPPVDLAACADALGRFPAWLYDRHLTSALRAQVRDPAVRRVRTLRAFDDAYTAPRAGFADATAYYAACSAGPLLPRIRVPTRILAARDDPVIPAAPLAAATLSPVTTVTWCARGGHLGFIADGRGGSRRWMDAWVEKGMA